MLFRSPNNEYLFDYQDNKINIGAKFDNENLENTDFEYISLDKLIEWATHEAYPTDTMMETLLYTYKMYTDSSHIISKLIKRFHVPTPSNMSK